jgi:hypothetical protein
MPLNPPFDFTDPSQSWQSHGPLRITVRPYPSNGPPGNRLASDGIDDWIVPSKGTAADSYPDDWIIPGNTRPNTSYPDDWIVPSKNVASDPYPDDWIVPAPESRSNSTRTPPNIQSAAAAINPLTTPVARSSAVPPIPLQSFWDLMPASMAGAMAWRPPIFLNADTSPVPDLPLSARPPFMRGQPSTSTSQDSNSDSLFPTNQSITTANGLLPDLSEQHPATIAAPALQSLLQNLSNLAPAGSITPSGDSYPNDWIMPGQTSAAESFPGSFMQPTPSTSAVPVSYQAAPRPWWNPPGTPGSVFDPWAEHFIKGIQGLINAYSGARSRSGGSGGDRGDECYERWGSEQGRCAMFRPFGPRYESACKTRASDRYRPMRKKWRTAPSR